MREVISGLRLSKGLVAVVVLLFCFWPNVSVAQTPRCKSADQCLSLGMFYYNNDDISDKASQLFSQVIARYATSAKQAESAQYFLGSYYQRKYYIQLQRIGTRNSALLEAAAKEYRKYTDKYYKAGSAQWLADAFFNQALAFLQLGNKTRAYEELSKMRDAQWRDGSVYIYEVIWSPKPEDVIDAYLPTRTLAEYSLEVLSGKSSSYETRQQTSINPARSFNSFEQQITAIKRWCQSQKSQRTNK